MSREQIEELLDVATRPRAEVVITQEDDASDLATSSWTEDTNQKSDTGEQQ
jgi:hypothetical protein